MKYRIGIVLAALLFCGYAVHVPPNHILQYVEALAVALIAAYLTTFTACSGVAKKLGEGIGEAGAAEAIGPETKKKIDDLIDEGKAKVKEIPTDEANKLIKDLDQMVKENEGDIRDLIKSLGTIGRAIEAIEDWLKAFMRIIDQLANDLDKLIAACIYFFYRLVEEVGDVLAELVAYLLYLTFKARLRKLIQRLLEKYWWLRFLAAVLR